MLYDKRWDRELETPDAAAFRKAAELLEARGWCQGQSATADGRLCAMGALWVAVTGLELVHFAAADHDKAHTYWRLLYRLKLLVGREVSEWNDVWNRERGHVIAALRTAAGQP